MSQASAHGSELFDGGVNVIGLGQQQLPVNVWAAAGCQHGLNLVQRLPGRLVQGNRCQMVQHARDKPAPHPGESHPGNQPLLLVIAQGGGG